MRACRRAARIGGKGAWTRALGRARLTLPGGTERSLARRNRQAEAVWAGCCLTQTVEPPRRRPDAHADVAGDESAADLEACRRAQQDRRRRGGSGGSGRHAVKTGDLIGCLLGDAGTAHQFVNTGSTELRYLAISSSKDPEICEFPDSGKVGACSGRGLKCLDLTPVALRCAGSAGPWLFTWGAFGPGLRVAPHFDSVVPTRRAMPIRLHFCVAACGNVLPTAGATQAAKCTGSRARPLGGGCGFSPRWLRIFSITGRSRRAAMAVEVSTPWRRISCSLDRATSPANRCMNSSGLMSSRVLPSRHGASSFRSAGPPDMCWS